MYLLYQPITGGLAEKDLNGKRVLRSGPLVHIFHGSIEDQTPGYFLQFGGLLSGIFLHGHVAKSAFERNSFRGKPPFSCWCSVGNEEMNPGFGDRTKKTTSWGGFFLS